ncbi:MAG: hypothetical protein KAQ62_23170 [Cyclobacteriaceae bacterium]|nr:hypothetical protein [Cyclobacteriaceae bacterium]MCK5702197.1 hypothetical protein [Cyclobacteriaceae bacterium]
MHKKDKLEITELFMAKAGKHGWDRCFHCTNKRETDADGNPVVYGKIKVLDGFICAQAGHQDELGTRLDELVKMVLDYSLHSDAGKTIKICDTDFFSN